ncbi:MAG TPA: trypsin-like peptidase domain-containing protein [Terriglobia bacterium]|nr:trypsin-like peptidase domain-containing protein [Terriglobia bacterium]
MKRIAWLVALTLTLSAPLLSAGQMTPAEKRTLEVKPAVVLVIVTFKTTWTIEVLPKPIELTHTETGTGFLYRPDGYLVTNGHVVADANIRDVQAMSALQTQIKQEFADAVQKGILFKYIEQQIGRALTDKEKEAVLKSKYSLSMTKPTLDVILANGKDLPGDILQYNPPLPEGKDVAVVKIGATNLPTVTLGNSDQARVQDTVMVVGFPGLASAWGGSQLVSQESNLVPSATNGHISAIKKALTGTPILQSDVAITHGNSGGPAFDAASQVIGIATWGEEVQGFNFLVPINTALEFVRQAGAAPEAGEFDQHWVKALDLFDAGKCNESMVEFGNVLEFMPNLPDAEQYRQASVQCWDSKNFVQRFMITSSWVVYAVIGMVILAGAILALRRRPAPAPAHAGAGGAVVGVEAVPPGALPPGGERAFGSIQVTGGPLAGKSFKLTKEGVLIGRSPKCQLVLQDDTVSTEHAWIVPVSEGVVVIDRGSSNGTYVNSVDSPRISKVGLRNGDRVFIGKKSTNVITYFSS